TARKPAGPAPAAGKRAARRSPPGAPRDGRAAVRSPSRPGAPSRRPGEGRDPSCRRWNDALFPPTVPHLATIAQAEKWAPAFAGATIIGRSRLVGLLSLQAGSLGGGGECRRHRDGRPFVVDRLDAVGGRGAAVGDVLQRVGEEVLCLAGERRVLGPLEAVEQR